MATDVDVDITDRAVISALNTPGGAVYEWRDNTATAIIAAATAISPVNDVLNALHRGGVVGTYKASWGFDRVGSNGNRVRATIYNGSDHADIVEEGRNRSFGPEVFSWVEHLPPGEIEVHLHGTAGREGKHVLQRAVNSVMPAATGGTAGPI